jgi:antitoxin component YwqK of YwqJK toxin-antitoxin module
VPMNRQTLYMLALSAISLTSAAQSYERPKFASPKDKHRNMRDEYERKQGLWKTYSASYICIAEINYLNDKKHGLCKRFYPHSGTLMEECEYFDGRKHGYEKKFYYTGANKQEGEYDFGLKTGVWVWYYLNSGEIRSEGKYIKGKKEGEWKLYNSRGDLKTTFVYKDGILISQNGVPVEALKSKETQSLGK